MCIVLGSFQEGIRAKKESALIWSQWIHILLLCFFVWPAFFLCFCFFVAAFTLLAPFQLRINMFISFFVCIFFILYSFHVPCVTSLYFMFPSAFCGYSVLAWQGTHDAGHTCWNIFYVHCFKPLSGRNRNEKEGASNLSGFKLCCCPLIVSCFFLVFLPGLARAPLIFM